MGPRARGLGNDGLGGPDGPEGADGAEEPGGFEGLTGIIAMYFV